MNKNTAQERRKLTGKLEEIKIQGFKSLKDVKLRLGDINILIGANGAGKSNLLGFFEMLNCMMNRDFRGYVARKGGSDDLLFNGVKQTQSIYARLLFRSNAGKNEYKFRLQSAEDERLSFGEEQHRFTERGKNICKWNSFGVGHLEAEIKDKGDSKSAQIVREMLRNYYTHQFHDTSTTGPMKLNWDVQDINRLKNSGGNLAPMLLDLKNNSPEVYQEITRIIREVFPAFKDFDLEVIHGKTRLKWTHHGQSDKSFGAHLTSDGTLRFMALTTLLCMPPERLLSDIILLDEPELGLHPDAISLVSAMIKRAAVDKQIIIATQSPLLLNDFDIENIIVAEMRERGNTVFKRLKKDEYKEWLDEFQTGELWLSNVVGGNPK